MELPDCTAAIIAGGMSRRFGSPKYLAVFNGRRLIDLALDLATTLCAQVLIVAGKNHLQIDRKVQIFADLVEGCGPLGGIFTALKQARSEWIAVLPVDMPLLQADVYQRLWQARTGQRPVVAHSGGKMESMVSLWHQSHLQFIEQSLKLGRWSVHHTLEDLQAVSVTFPENQQYQFANINFRSDLEKLEEKQRQLQERLP